MEQAQGLGCTVSYRKGRVGSRRASRKENLSCTEGQPFADAEPSGKRAFEAVQARAGAEFEAECAGGV